MFQLIVHESVQIKNKMCQTPPLYKPLPIVSGKSANIITKDIEFKYHKLRVCSLEKESKTLTQIFFN